MPKQKKHPYANLLSMFLILFFLVPLLSFSQEQPIRKDTISCRYRTYFAGKEVQLNQSRSVDHFDYVYWASADPSSPIGSRFEKTILVVEEVYALRNKLFLKCIGKDLPREVHIDIEGAIDNNELK